MNLKTSLLLVHLLVLVLSATPSWAYRNTSTNPVNWGDLDLAHTYPLAQRLNFAAGLWVRAGAALQIVEIESLAPVPVFRVEAVIQNCSGSMIDREAPLRVVRAPSGLEFGVELERGCRVGIYVEQKDFYRPSLFLQRQAL